MKILFLILIFCFQSSKGFDFEKLQTNSGIQFWFVKDNSIPIISVNFSFSGGSSLEKKENHGLSNLMVAMMDEGTENYNSKEFKNTMKLNGMKLSFSSQKNRIDGVFQIISSQSKEGFNLFKEALNFPKFSEDEIEKVKKQIVASIKIDQSNISSIASDKFNENFFGDHIFSRNIKGSIDSIQNFKRKDLIEFHKKAFQKKNLVIGVAGDIDKKKIINFIDFVFGDLEDTYQIPVIDSFSDLSVGEKLYEIKTPQTSVLFGHPGLARNDKDFFALRIANYILGGGGFQSRLYKNIREKKGLVYSVYSYLLPYENDGVLVGGFQTRNKSVYKTIKSVKKNWRDIQKKGISKDELENAKDYFNGSFTRNFTSTNSIAGLLQIVQYYKLGDNYFKRREEIINSVDLKKVNEVATQYFKSEDLFFMIVGEPDRK